MWLLILEALVALALLCGAVWWTFSGRRREAEPEPEARTDADDDRDPPPPPR